MSIAALGACFLSSSPTGASAAEPRNASAASAARVDAARLEHADQDPANWLSYGRTYDEQRFSPLSRITAANVNHLGLAWFADFDTNRGQEATPLVIDGVLYVSTAWSMVRAFDAKSGRPLWSFDPQVPRIKGVRGCCDVVNRGVAAWQGKLYVATFDGRLIALDAVTGKPLWSVLTVDPAKPYTITMAPRVVKGRVLIGNSGNEFGVRGYLSAYDAATGALVWRFYTVPGDPAKPFESPALAMAAKTWSGSWWKLGGGGTVWDAISYDPKLNLIYFGVGNGSEWDQAYRSEGKGDNLFLSSIVAVNADSGDYVWHYQATPGEEWDYDAVQQLVLADITISHEVRQVLIQANKNGFLYVLDRRNGHLISANAFTPVTWASGVDLATGRPIEQPAARYDRTGKAVQLLPGALGAHNWQPMAFNPTTGLVYIPAQEIGMGYEYIKGFKPAPLGWNLGVATTNTGGVKGYLIAWDPVAGKELWRANKPGPWNGGVLTTAGNLVVQGDATGALVAYRADNGERLWSGPTESPVMAAPMSYEVDGEQYIAVLAGWGGAYPLLEGRQSSKSGNIRNISRLLVYRLGGELVLPPVVREVPSLIPLLDDHADAATLANGEALYGKFCSVCHGQGAVGGGVIPDLRKSPYLSVEAWFSITLDGALSFNGMAPFAEVIDRAQSTSIRDYVIHRASADDAELGAAPAAGNPAVPGDTAVPGNSGLPAAAAVHDPDLARGAVIAAQGNGAGAPACALCHGYNGISDGSGAFPRIAGQSPYYLSKQLYAFRTGVRKNAIMSPIASRLGAADIVDVSAHYAAAVAPFMPLAAGDAALVKRGEQLANAGRAAVIGTAAEHNRAALGMPACSVCHGADGGGQTPTIPYLKGQYAQYLSFELRMWKLGFRRTSTDAMALIAPQLNERDIAALAAYYQQLATPAPPAQLPPAQAPAAQQRRAQLPPTQALAATASRTDR